MRLLDITRLLSRVGRGPLTGVDRVEAAYLERFLAGTDPALFLAATRGGLLLLDRAAGARFRERLSGARDWGRPDLRARLSRRLPEPRRRAEASLRREALGRLTGANVLRLIPEGTAYYNTGHANLSEGLLSVLGALPGVTRHVLVHDTIPLDHPDWSDPGVPARFAEALRAVGGHADRVIHVSADTRTAAERHFARWGRVPPGITAHIGIEIAAAVPEEVPGGLPRDRPYFVVLGTIEPRKNHALLLDVWDGLARSLPAARVPRLFVLGSRGWRNDTVFRRLDAVKAAGDAVRECAGLSDGAVAALVDGAAGLLMPSRAEGFGIPPLEAAARGTPVVAAPLPVYRETLGDLVVYADPDDRYSWTREIERLAGEWERPDRARRPAVSPPTWEAHFRTVLGPT